jgi:glutaredoxin
MTSPPRVTVYTRPDCHLCEVAVQVVGQVCAEAGEAYVEVDITTDPDLEDAYGEEIPVTLVDGRRHDFYRVDPVRLRAALARPV